MIRELWAVYKVLRWHKKAFPKVTYKEQTAKRREEILEWLEAFEKYTKDKRKVKKYCAEMEWHILLLPVLDACGSKKTRSDIDDKMVANRKRVFKNNHHVEE